MKYVINDDLPFDEGGSAEFYNLANHKNLGFKQFRNKRFADEALKKQKLLSKFHLAPKVITGIIKLPIVFEYFQSETNWGFITEKARLVSEKMMKKRMKSIQKLVDDIHEKTGLKFWDCHYYNIGYIKRSNKFKLVCIDTGNESFLRDSNAWGMNSPGPFCLSCNKFQCECSVY